MDRKRILILIFFTIVVFGIGFLLWRVFFASPIGPTTAPPSTGTPTTPGTQFPSAGTGGDRPGISDDPSILPIVPGGPGLPVVEQERQITVGRVRAVSLSATGNLRFYSESDGKFYTLDENGNLVPLSDDVFFQANSVTWSPIDNKSIIEYPDGSNIYYNFDTKEQVTLPRHWEDFSFSPQADKIAAKSVALAPENRFLITANPNGQEVRLIEPMGNYSDKVEVDWSPNKQVLAFSKTGNPLGANRQEILLVGQYGENFKSLVVEGRGFDSTWSDDGSRVIYDVYSQRNQFKPELWVVDASGEDIGDNRRQLNINTWVDKCGFQDSRFIYCGVPTTLKTGSGFAPEMADNTPDRIVRIDTVTGLQTDIAVDGTYVVDSLIVSEDGSRLYITDKRTSELTEIAL